MTPPVEHPQKNGRKPAIELEGRHAHNRGRDGVERDVPSTLENWEMRAAAAILTGLEVPWSIHRQRYVAALIRAHATGEVKLSEAPFDALPFCGSEGRLKLDRLEIFAPARADPGSVSIRHVDGEAGDFNTAELQAALEEFFWRAF